MLAQTCRLLGWVVSARARLTLCTSYRVLHSPLSMFKALSAKWCGATGLTPKAVGEKVKFFFDK